MKPANKKRTHVISIRVTPDKHKILAMLRKKFGYSNSDSVEIAIDNTWTVELLEVVLRPRKK